MHVASGSVARSVKNSSAAEAIALIEDHWTVVSAGIAGGGHPEALTRALEERFHATGHPRALTLVHSAGHGDRASRGLNHFGMEGMTTAVVGAHWRTAPKLTDLIQRDKAAAWNLPQGVISHLFRTIAAGGPGVMSRVGLHTYVDPLHDAACMNASARVLHEQGQGRVERIKVRNEEVLFYPAFPIHCALIRATSADRDGNLSFEHEPCHQDALAIAQATRNSGGIVLAQVKRMVDFHADANAIRVPGICVDRIVCVEDETDHPMTFGEQFNPAYIGTWRQEDSGAVAPLQKRQVKIGAREVIQRRAILEMMRLQPHVVNLGIGIPAGLATQARAFLDNVVFCVESGCIGGTPVEGFSFGASNHPVAILDAASTFDFYDGGGLDVACLGVGEFDGEGNVNVSRFGEGDEVVLAGSGGFINITQGTRNLLFLGTFRAGGLKVSIGDGVLRIDQEGSVPKLVSKVSHLSFNGPYAEQRGARVMFITERAVFELRQGKLVLTEIAPGIDLDRDILSGIEGELAIDPNLKLMPSEIFAAEMAPMDQHHTNEMAMNSDNRLDAVSARATLA